MPVQISQVRRKDFNDERIGMGFNSETCLAIGTALEGFTVSSDPDAPGQEVDSEITIISTHEELLKSLGMSFEAQGRYSFFSASAKVKFSETSSFNSTSTFLVARCVVKNPLKRMGDSFRVKQAAQSLLDSHRFDDFKRAFGDSFVRGLQTGGEFYAVIRITSISTSKQIELGGTLHGEMNGLLASGSFKTQYTQANASASTRSEYTARFFQRAGSGIQTSPPVEISEVITRYKQFTETVRLSPIAYETEVATYDTLPLSVPTPVEQENFLLALRDAQDKKLHYIQKKNDLEFARGNPVFFKDLPPDDVLLKAINDYTKLINAVMDHGIKLSRGEMSPPQVFDPSALSPPINEPAPILLKRATPSDTILPTIRVPNMVGYNGYEFEFALRCLSEGSIDDCLAGTVEPYRDGGPQPISFPRDGAEFLVLSISGQVKLTFDPGPDFYYPHEIYYISNSGIYVCTAQFPSAGTLVATGSEVILQFVCTSAPNC
ncbi:TPA: hypothetical protein QCY03_003447 [Bacillus tropicus]|nr:hypothetical protein [Bacillus tropicus]